MPPIPLQLWQRLRRLDAAGCSVYVQRRVPIGAYPSDPRRVWCTHVSQTRRLAWQGVEVEQPDLTESLSQAVDRAERRGWGKACTPPAGVPVDDDLWHRLCRLDRTCMASMCRDEAIGGAPGRRIWAVGIRRLEGVKVWDTVREERPTLRAALLAAIEDAERRGWADSSVGPSDTHTGWPGGKQLVGGGNGG